MNHALKSRRFFWDPDCPLHGTDHYQHWYPTPDVDPALKSRTRCNGYHSLVREITTVKARFHKPYLRGRNSNLIHRSAHTGQIVWFPWQFYEYGPSYPAFWEVDTCCSQGMLKNPEMLTFDEVREARPFIKPHLKYKEIMLCGQCFNQPPVKRGRKTMWKAVPRDGIALGSPDSEGRLADSSSEVHHEEAGSSRDLRVSDPPRNFSQRDRWFAQP